MRLSKRFSRPPTIRGTVTCCSLTFGTAISRSAGRWQEILDPTLTVDHPYYRFSLISGGRFALDGRDQVAALYGHWTATNQCVFYVEDELGGSRRSHDRRSRISYQQTLSSELAGSGVDADADAMYLTKSQICMVWTYDDRCRLIGEDVWEFDDAERAHIKLEPTDVLTAEQSGKLLEPFIKPLTPFDDSLFPA